MTEPYQKPALTFEEQLKLLKERGLIVNDDQEALAQLSTISYYRLSAYWYPFRVRDNNGIIQSEFIEDANFNDIIKLYEFDRHLRLLLIDAIERVEIHIRTLMTYHLGHEYGAFGHTDASNFRASFRHRDWLNRLEQEIKRSSDSFITHYRTNYDGFPTLPIWMLTEVMTLGSLSVAYNGLTNSDKRSISSKLGLHYNRLSDWMRTLTYIQNICTHHGRLWNRELSIQPENVSDVNWNSPITPRKDRLFYILLILRSLLKTTKNGDEWHRQCNTLLEPIATEDKWRIAMGMPENWENHPIWL